MSPATWFALIVLVIFCSLWFYRYYIKPRSEKQRMHQQTYSSEEQATRELLAQLYQGVDGGKIAAAERKRLNNHERAFVYGEVAIVTFFELLKFVEPQPGEVFYDLGCGTGKTVFAAALLYDLSKSSGIELLPKMFQVCDKALYRFQTLIHQFPPFKEKYYPIEFLHQSILETDYSDADIIFANSTAFFDELWQGMLEQLVHLKPGTRVIVTSRELPKEHFELLDDRQRLMSWGLNTVRIYRKK